MLLLTFSGEQKKMIQHKACWCRPASEARCRLDDGWRGELSVPLPNRKRSGERRKLTYTGSRETERKAQSLTKFWIHFSMSECLQRHPIRHFIGFGQLMSL